MKIKISYFYKVRFFKPNEIPLSTAISDPKWYHDNKSQEYSFKDKRGVVNGLRAPVFAPGPLTQGTCSGREKCSGIPEKCRFLQLYYFQLKALDFSEIMRRFERLGNAVKEGEGFEGEPTIVLLVHEAPDNPCSERSVLIKWFKENNYELKEYDENVSD